MTRPARPHATLDTLNDERDHLAIQISLAADAETPDSAQLAVLRGKLNVLERRISHCGAFDVESLPAP
ncbi:hypothetical protein [Sphingomonas sp.]|uniref:hypothetical protein n=1 Tax=Sphingomonas sp. TaxID=28214 RepID=UPI0038A88C54